MNILITTASLAWAALVNRSALVDFAVPAAATAAGEASPPSPSSSLLGTNQKVLWTRSAPQRHLNFAVTRDNFVSPMGSSEGGLGGHPPPGADATVVEDVVVVCSTFDARAQRRLSDHNLAQSTAEQYIAIGRDMNKWTFELGPSPCVISDLAANRIFAVADAVGSMPIWYALRSIDDSAAFEASADAQPRFDFFMSTDPLFDVTFADELSSVPPGFIMGFDLTKRTLFFAIHWSSLQAHAESDPTNMEPFSPRSYGYELLSSLHDEVHAPELADVSVLLELDNARVASKLLMCELDAMGTPFGLRETRPRVYDRAPVLPHERLVEEFIAGVPPALLDSELYEDFGGRTTVRRLIFDRFELCSSAIEYARLKKCSDPSDCIASNASSSAPPRIISHIDGRTAQPYAAWLLGHVCSKLGVEVVYPFASKALQDIIFRFPNLKVSAMEQAVPLVLEDDFTCKLPGRDKMELYNDVRTFTLPLPRTCADRAPSYLDAIYDHRMLGPVNVEVIGAQCLFPSCAVDAIDPIDTKCGSPLSLDRMNAKDQFLLCLCNSTNLSTYRSYKVYSSQQSAVGRLMEVLSTIKKKSKDVLLLLATDGYSDMLENFLCSLQAAYKIDSAHDDNGIIIVGRQRDHAISKIADSFGAIFFSESVVSDIHGCNDGRDGAFEFGAACYQQQILARTKVAMYLLLLGYAPLIADIDTVWTRNAFKEIYMPSGAATIRFLNIPSEETETKNFYVDMVAALDAEEICGCFVYLRPGHRTIAFWSAVTKSHSEIVLGIPVGEKFVSDFFNSEQKVLTKLILKSEYASRLVVKILDRSTLPSGYDYFNLNCCRPNETNIGAAIIHNNYIIGIDAKRARFQRYGLWSSSIASNTCSNSQNDAFWDTLFSGTHFNTSIPTLNIIAPVHNSKSSSPEFLFSAAKENYDGVTMQQSEIHFSSDPPQHIPTGSFLMATARQPASDPFIQSFGIASKIDETYAFADVAMFKSNFAVDRQGEFHDIADSQAESFSSEAKDEYSCGENNSCKFQEPSGNASRVLLIRVITYNRPVSLSRLLNSLARGIYFGDKVDVEISIDGPKYKVGEEGYSIENALRKSTESVANGFQWDHGRKIVIVRRRNIGVWGQWMLAWMPQSVSEAALILEDDVELSPMFYLYAKSAMAKYIRASNPPSGGGDFDLRTAHIDLLNAVRTENYLSRHGGQRYSMHWNLTTDVNLFIRDESLIFSNGNNLDAPSDGSLSPLKAFAKRYAGLPVIESIALNSQYLDPLRPGQPLNVKNARSPFLYSWGPLMLPLPWRAFLEWWRERLPHRAVSWVESSSQEGPGASSADFRFTADEINLIFERYKVENLVSNYFWEKNLNIWTPWMIRFAYETGAKTLYPNFRNTREGSKVLVTNHRESGDNYELKLGTDEILASSLEDLLEMVVGARTIATATIQRSRIVTFCESEKQLFDKVTAMNADFEGVLIPASHQCIAACGSMSQQYDPMQLYALAQCVTSKLPSPAALAWWQFDFNLRRPGAIGESDGFILDGYEAFLNLTQEAADGECKIKISNLHWGHIFRMMKGHIPRSSTIFAIGWQQPMNALISGFYNSSKRWRSYFLDVGVASYEKGGIPSVLRLVDWNKGRPSSLDYWTNFTDAVIIRSCDSTSLSIARSILDLGDALQFIVVLVQKGCNSAPTVLEVQNDYFASLESVCNLGRDGDSGAVLYRRVSSTRDKSSIHTASTVKRLSGSLLLREFNM